jgi:nucleoside-diphosphate-sugar epimerase
MGNETVLVTGSTGFVGGRLVERLVLGTDYKAVAMVRRFSGPGLARLARLPVDLVLGDVLDLESLIRAAKGCDVIVHCAYGSGGDESQRMKTTVSGTENVLQAALQADVRKVIYLSSAAVHGRNPQSAVVDESAPFKSDGDCYSVSKIEAERIVWRYHQEQGLPVVVFRPTLIYGPYGRMWTVRIVEEIKSGAVLVNGGCGAANLIYIDNLVDAILLAMDTGCGDGEAFNLVDDDSLTWQKVYQSYADMMGDHPPLRSMSREEIEAVRRAGEPTGFTSWVIAPLLLIPEMIGYSLQSSEIQDKVGEIPWAGFVTQLWPRRLKDWIMGMGEGRGNASTGIGSASHVQLPSEAMVELYTSQSRFSNEKAKSILGYTERITFDEAIELTGSWLRYQRLVP